MKYIIFTCTILIASIITLDTNAQKPAPQYLRIEFHIKPEAEVEFKSIMSSINDLMAGEEGFQSARVFHHNDNPLRVTLIEKWASLEAHQTHFKKINSNGEWMGILQMLQSDPPLVYLREAHPLP